MSVYIVYHNTENEELQRIPFAGGRNPFDRFYDEWICTARDSTLKQAVAERGWCLFIVSLGKPKRFYLWGFFQLLASSEARTGAGEGWMLNPPQKLEGAAFKSFKDNDCGQFGMGLQNVTDLPFAASLIHVAGEFHKPKITRDTLRFCTELRGLTKDGGDLQSDVRELEQYVRKALARGAGQKPPKPQSKHPNSNLPKMVQKLPKPVQKPPKSAQKTKTAVRSLKKKPPAVKNRTRKGR